MNYVKKIEALVNKAKEDGYKTFFEGDKARALSFFEEEFCSFVNYVNAVATQQMLTPIWRARYEREELIDKIEQADRTRRLLHNNAISAVTMLNRVFSKYGLEPFANINTADRQEVADFVGDFVGQVYRMGIGRTFDQVVSVDDPYDTAEVSKVILDAADGNDTPGSGEEEPADLEMEM